MVRSKISLVSGIDEPEILTRSFLKVKRCHKLDSLQKQIQCSRTIFFEERDHQFNLGVVQRDTHADPLANFS